MSDAAHLLSDILGFIISIFSIYISQRKANSQMSYGYHRAEVIGALVSVNIIWGLTIWLFYEATLRVITSEPVDGFIMLITAVLGFVFNIIMGLILSYQGIDHQMHGHSHDEDEGHGHSHGAEGHSHELVDKKEEEKGLLVNGKKQEAHAHAHDEKDPNHAHSHDVKKAATPAKTSGNHGHSHDEDEEENINIRAALIHVIGDAIQNLGVVIAGIIIYYQPTWSIADPICTYVFSVIVLFTTIRIMKQCISVLMEEAPIKMDIDQLKLDFEKIEGVIECHDLHVWALSHSKLSLSCHLTSSTPQASLTHALNLCRNKYKIKHCTIQVEESDGTNICDDDHGIH
jgi:zinc transporter 2